MNHIGILKAAHHMNNGVHLTDIRQKLIAQALTLRRALYQSRNIHKLFNSLTKAGAESANYPFCTIDPNVGVVAVPLKVNC